MPTARSPRHAALLALALSVALALSASVAPRSALADGYNDWSGELAGPGELYIVPAVQTSLRPQFSAYWQWQNQLGLTDNLDLIVTFATTQEGGAWMHDLAYIQPRWALTDSLNISLGLFVPPSPTLETLNAMPGIFHTITWADDAWQLNWNFVGYVPLGAPADAEHYSPIVLQRRFSETFAVYAEVDLYGPLATPADTTVELYAGVEWGLTDDDTLNICVMMPTRPTLQPEAAALGIWYARGVMLPWLRSKTNRGG